jgi:hypothetical protein
VQQYIGDIMSAFQPFTELADETTVYSVCLLTQLPYPTVSGLEDDDNASSFVPSQLVQIPDAGYAPQDTTCDVAYSDSEQLVLELDPVTFCGLNYASTYTVVGVAVVCNSVQGYQVCVAVQALPSPQLIGPQTPCLVVDGPINYVDFSSMSDCDWSNWQ